MKMNVYAIKDIKTGYVEPQFFLNDEVAARWFKFAISKPGTLELANVQDFQMFRIGTYDNDLGVIDSEEHKLILDGSSLLRGENDEN